MYFSNECFTIGWQLVNEHICLCASVCHRQLQSGQCLSSLTLWRFIIPLKKIKDIRTICRSITYISSTFGPEKIISEKLLTWYEIRLQSSLVDYSGR